MVVVVVWSGLLCEWGCQLDVWVCVCEQCARQCAKRAPPKFESACMHGMCIYVVRTFPIHELRPVGVVQEIFLDLL